MDIVIPNLAESVTEGDLAAWLKKDGERVEKDELILELETDKASVELAAEASGTLEILVEAGQTVHVGDVVGRIVEEGGGPAKAEPKKEVEPEAKEPERKAEPAKKAAERPAEDGKPARAREERPEKPGEKESGKPAKPGEAEESTEVEKPERPEKAAERVASETVRGPEKKEAAETPERPAHEAEPGTRRVRMSRLRRRIAERLVEAQGMAAILTTFNEIDMTEVLALRKEHQADFEARHGVRLGFMSLFAKASILALRDFPEINAFTEGDEIVYHDYVDLGIAVGTPRGLVVPVLRHAERMSFAEIEREIKELAARARDGELTIDELQGGTFTISNGGIYGSLMSTPILNPPQSGILGMHKIEKRAVVFEDPATKEERIVSRPMMYVALSYDHRIVDGEEAVSFLVRVKERLESPARLLLDS